MKFDWTTDVENCEGIGKDAAAAMMALAERRLSETVSTAETITKKAETLLTITISLLTIAVGYLLKDARSTNSDEFLFNISLLTLLPLTAALFFIIRNLLPYSIDVPGASPKNTFRSSRFDIGLTTDLQYIHLIVDILQQHQDRIDHNEDCNRRRRNNNFKAQVCFIFLPFVIFLAFVVDL
jgi:hypothetical protein